MKISSSSAGAAALSTAAASAAAPTVQRGRGAVIEHGNDYVGQYRIWTGGRWADVYCINPNRQQPSRATLSTVARVTGLSTTVSRELAEVLAAHGQTASTVQAEAVSQALNYLAGNRKDVARRAHYVAASTERLAMSYVREAQHLRGGYTVTVRVNRAAAITAE